MYVRPSLDLFMPDSFKCLEPKGDPLAGSSLEQKSAGSLLSYTSKAYVSREFREKVNCGEF